MRSSNQKMILSKLNLMIENQQLNHQVFELKDSIKKAKQIIETNKLLKEENEKLKKTIKYLQEH